MMFLRTKTSAYEIKEVFPNKYKIKKYNFLSGETLKVRMEGSYEGNKIVLNKKEELELFQKGQMILKTGGIIDSYFFKPSFLKKV